MEGVRSYLRDRIVGELESLMIDSRDMKKSKVPKFIRSINDQIEKTIDDAIKSAKEDMIEFGAVDKDLKEFIHSFEGDWLREFMAEHIECFR